MMMSVMDLIHQHGGTKPIIHQAIEPGGIMETWSSFAF